MEVILIILTSTIMSAFFVGFFLLGRYVEKKHEAKEYLTLDANNQESVKSLMEWLGFKG